MVYGSANPARLPPHACVSSNSRCPKPTPSHANSNSHSRSHADQDNHNGIGDEGGEDEEGFYLRDTSLVFPIFSAVITRFVLRKATWTSDRVSRLFLAMASRHGLAATNSNNSSSTSGSGNYDDHNEEAVHVLRSLDARAMVLTQHNRLHEALTMYDRCAEMYHPPPPPPSHQVDGNGAVADSDNSHNPQQQQQPDLAVRATLNTQSQSQSQSDLVEGGDIVNSSTSAIVDDHTAASTSAVVVAATATTATATAKTAIIATAASTKPTPIAPVPSALSLAMKHKRLSEDMIRIYGADRGVIAIARGAMWNALAGRWTRARELAILAEPLLATLVLPGTNLLIPSAFPALRFIGSAYELSGHADKAWLLSQKALAFARSFSLSQNHLCMVARQTHDVFHEMYRRKALAMALQERIAQMGNGSNDGSTGSNHGSNYTSNHAAPPGSGRPMSSARVMPLPDEDPLVSEEVIERILAEASLSDQHQLTPPSAGGGGNGSGGGGGGGAAAGSKNIFASLTDPRSVVGNARLCVNVSRSYYSAKAEMCSLLGTDWLAALIRTTTTTTAAATATATAAAAATATVEGSSSVDATERQGLANPSPNPLRDDIYQELGVNSNQWLGGSGVLPTLVQIKEVLELGLRCADAAIGACRHNPIYPTLPYRNSYPTLIQHHLLYSNPTLLSPNLHTLIQPNPTISHYSMIFHDMPRYNRPI